jgi:hypothetical protein
MRPAISMERLSPTLTLSECHASSDYPKGYWLYDSTRGMNLAMGALTKEAALLKAVEYYQKRLTEVENNYKDISKKVEAFVAQFAGEED